MGNSLRALLPVQAAVEDYRGLALAVATKWTFPVRDSTLATFYIKAWGNENRRTEGPDPDFRTNHPASPPVTKPPPVAMPRAHVPCRNDDQGELKMELLR